MSQGIQSPVKGTRKIVPKDSIFITLNSTLFLTEQKSSIRILKILEPKHKRPISKES